MKIFMRINAWRRLNQNNLIRTHRCLIIVSLVIISLNIYKGFTEYSALIKWQSVMGNGAKVISSNMPNSISKNLLGHNGKFLSAYGIWLTQDSARFREGMRMLEKAQTYFISRSSTEYLAKAYSQGGNYEKSIEQWQWVSNYLPNRFLPRYELMSTYLAAGDTISAKKTARSILDMPVKFYSGEVERIKLAASHLIR